MIDNRDGQAYLDAVLEKIRQRILSINESLLEGQKRPVSDIELKALSAQQASRWAVEQTSSQNTPWDVRADAARLTVPTHIIASDPTVYSIFTGRLADEVRQLALHRAEPQVDARLAEEHRAQLRMRVRHVKDTRVAGRFEIVKRFTSGTARARPRQNCRRRHHRKFQKLSSMDRH